ncbi:hypothetical protein GI482_03060 [Bacillus sp. N3536]|nr:hypothetical protein GI482_03060 [Bacillus sp. N3536]
MDDKKLEVRLELLKDSYERVPSSINPDEILKKMVKEKETNLDHSKKKKTNWQRIAVWTVSLASVFVIGILSATLLNDNQTGSKIKETTILGDIEEYEKKYAEERLKRQKILEMDEDDFNGLDFVIYADNIFATQISPGSLEGKNDDITIEEAYHQAIQGLKLPSEMIEEVKKGKVMNSYESMKFVDEFVTKANILITHYNHILYKDREALRSAVFDGKLNKNMLQAKREEKPKKIQTMLKVLPKQGLNIEVNQSGTEFFVLYNSLAFNQDFNEKLNDYASGYIFLQNVMLNQYSDNNSMGDGNNLVSNLVSNLRGIEIVLLNTDPSFSVHTNLETFYFTVVESMLLGEYNSALLDEDQKVRQEYQLAWSYLADTPGESPIATFMRKFLDVMEENNWKYTFNYKDLNLGQFRDLYNQALEGNLDYVKLDWEAMLPEKISASMEVAKEGDVAYLYKRFGESFDTKHLHGIGPIEIAVLYDYAEDQHNLDMMWKLLSDDVRLESSKGSFFKSPVSLIAESSTMLYYQQSKNQVENSVLTTVLDQGDEEKIKSNIPMRLDEDNIWRINIPLSVK